MLNFKFDINMELHLWKLDCLCILLPQKEMLKPEFYKADTNLRWWCFIYHFYGSSIHWKYFLCHCGLLAPLFCHLLGCPSISDRQCCASRPENSWREVEGWECLELESWLRTACPPAAASVLGDFLFSCWDRKAEMCCIFWLVFFFCLPSCFGLCGRSSLWIV